MSLAIAPSPWPLPPGVPRGAPWVYGREVQVGDPGGALGTVRGLQWLLRRNQSLSPRQVGLAYLALAAVSLAVAGFFFFQGAPYVAAFTGIELLAVGLALLVFARHAGDRETLTLVGHSLQVEQCWGTRVARTDFCAEWLRVEPAAGQGSLVEISGRGRRVRVGRHLRPEHRGAFARELRLALRRATA